MLFSRFLLRIIEIYRNKEEILIVGLLSFLRMLFQSRFSFEVTKSIERGKKVIKLYKRGNIDH